ncbi:phosphopantetheine-binding protein [Streptomyces sp. NBRC 109706]|uniref:phosphopantetheine-binding protein n=1 Tax=Streptomyces sp. NBRC 109706 TaxID=1550035 RepID=UPI0007805742|nr:phosphopantetheine-binding protein [Streptomyces sp. NBRC 109706]
MSNVEDVQESVREMFAGVLNLEKVDLDDDFFALGGHSLTAGRLTGRVKRELGVRVALSDFFSEPTVRGLSELVLAARQVRSTS